MPVDPRSPASPPALAPTSHPTESVAPLSDEALDAIQERANAATPGPWATSSQQDQTGEWEHSLYARRKNGDRLCLAGGLDADDCIFIASARSDVSALLAEVRRLRREVDNMCDDAAIADGTIEGYERFVDTQTPMIEALSAEVGRLRKENERLRGGR